MLRSIAIIGSLLQLTGTSVYVKNTLRGYTQPNRVTFLIWAAGPMIAFAAGFISSPSWALLPVFMAGFGPLLIFLASFVNSRAYWKLGVLDWTCGALAVAALVLWRLTNDPSIAIVFAILADGLALLPTAIKSWKYPETETGFSFLMSFINVCIGLSIAQVWNFAEVGFLLYLLIADGLPVIFIYRHGFFSRIRKEITQW